MRRRRSVHLSEQPVERSVPAGEHFPFRRSPAVAAALEAGVGHEVLLIVAQQGNALAWMKVRGVLAAAHGTGQADQENGNGEILAAMNPRHKMSPCSDADDGFWQSGGQTGMSDRIIHNGIREINAKDALSADRQRRPGSGRLAREDEQPKLLAALERLVEPVSRGDPMSPLRWSCKSMRILAKELQRQGFSLSHTKVGQLLKAKGYSLQANRKTREGKQHPDRNAQFEHINRRVKACLRREQPAVSVDTKKKEVLGNHKNAGRSHGPDCGGLSFSPGHEQMEQDRASLVLPHHAQLARRALGDARDRGESHRLDANDGRLGSSCLAR